MFYGTRKFNITPQALSYNFYSEMHLIQFLVLIPISLRGILILFSHLCQGLRKVLFPVGLPFRISNVHLPSSILTTWPAYHNLLHLITLTILGERYKLWSLLHSPFSFLLVPDIRLRILFSNIFSLHSSLNVRDNVS